MQFVAKGPLSYPIINHQAINFPCNLSEINCNLGTTSKLGVSVSECMRMYDNARARSPNELHYLGYYNNTSKIFTFYKGHSNYSKTQYYYCARYQGVHCETKPLLCIMDKKLIAPKIERVSLVPRLPDLFFCM